MKIHIDKRESPTARETAVRVVGSSMAHSFGHQLYLRVLDLIEDFDISVKQRFKEEISKDEMPDKEKFNS